MIIQSNINSKNKVHDVILFEPIEKQIHDELVTVKNFTYEISKDYYLFKIEHALIRVSVKKGKVNITVEGHYEAAYNPNLWSDIKPFEIKLKVNVDVSEDWNKIIAYVDNINNFQKEYLVLINTVIISDSDIANELGKYINNDILEVKYYTSFNAKNFGFYISPKGDSPANGVHYAVVDNNNVVEIDYQSMDNLINHLHLGNDILALRKKMDIITYIDDKVSKFDLNNFPTALAKYQHMLKIRILVNKYGIKSRYNN